MISELRRQRLAGRVGRADVLAAPALGARERVEHLLPGQVGDGAGAEAHAPPRALSKRSGSSRPRARVRAEEDVERRGGDVQVLRVRQVGEEAEDDQHVRPHEDALEHLGRVPSPNRCESAFETGDQPAGHSFSPSAIRDRVPEQQRR